jgi:hypothetical protein
MKRTSKFGLVIITVLIVGSGWFAYSKVAEVRRESTYREALIPFQHDLRVGMSRADVERYLKNRNIDYHAVSYGTDADTYEIKIGEDPGGPFCKSWNVYVALEFNAAYNLQEIHIRKIGTCL